MPATTIVTFTAHETRTQLGSLCETVEYLGAHVSITRRGRPVAEAMPYDTYVRYCVADGEIDPDDAVRIIGTRRSTPSDPSVGSIDWTQVEDTQIQIDSTSFRIDLSEILSRVSIAGMHATVLRHGLMAAVLVSPEWAANMRQRLDEPSLKEKN